MTALDIFQKYVDRRLFTPSCFQQDLIQQTVVDLRVWEETLIYWIGNSYRPQSVQKMLSYYSEQVAKPRWQDVGRNTEPVECYPDCATCNNSRKIGWIFYSNGELNTLESKPTPCPECVRVN